MPRKTPEPRAGSRIEAAQKYGIDLTLLIEQLRLTPDQRIRKLEAATKSLETIRGIARRRTRWSLGVD